MGVGNHNTGTAGICTGDLVDSVCFFAASVDTQGDVLGTWGNSDIVDVVLPIPIIECLIALPFLCLEPLADLVLANPLWVPFGGSCIFPFSTCALEWVICICSYTAKECSIIQLFYGDRVNLAVLS